MPIDFVDVHDCLLSLYSLCSGPGGHHHSGMVHRDHVCGGSHCTHPSHCLLHQKEPRREVSRYNRKSCLELCSCFENYDDGQKFDGLVFC